MVYGIISAIAALVGLLVMRLVQPMTTSSLLQYVSSGIAIYVTYNWLVAVSLDWITNHPVTFSKPERLSCLRVAAPTEATVKALLAYLPLNDYRIQEVDLSAGRIVMSDYGRFYPIYISPSEDGSRVEIGAVFKMSNEDRFIFRNQPPSRARQRMVTAVQAALLVHGLDSSPC